MNALVTLLYVGACVLALVLSFNIGRGKVAPVEEPVLVVAPVPQPVTALPKPKPKKVPPALSPFAEAAEEIIEVRGGEDFRSVAERLTEASAKVGVGVDPEALLLVNELEAGDFPAAVDAVMAMPEAGRKELLHAVLARWANFEPELAAQFALDRIPMYEVVAALSAVVGGWASHDGESALSWTTELLDSERIKFGQTPREMMKPLFFAWAKNDLQAAAAAAAQVRWGHRGTYAWKGLGRAAGLVGQRDAALEFALQMPEGNYRDLAIGHGLSSLAEDDPAAAAAWLDRNDVHHFDAAWPVFSEFIYRDPRVAAEWLEGRALTEEKRQSAIITSILNWARVDVEAAGAWLDGVAPNDRSLQTYAEYVATVDIAKAVEWAMRATPAGRDKVIANTLAKALKHDPNADVAPYLTAGSVSAAAMAAKVGVAQPDPDSAF